jgi:hypothetical protein
MVTPAQAKARMKAHYDRNFRVWAVELARAPEAPLDPKLPVVALRPPSESEALAKTEAVRAWVHSWSDPAVEWAARQWPSFGAQVVPVRLVAASAEEAARLAGQSRHWATVTERVGILGAKWGLAGQAASGALPVALRRHARALGALAPADFARLASTVEWLVDHPAPGLYVRQLPIRGIDSKWIESHASLTGDLLAAVCGRPDSGLVTPPRRLRLRLLDSSLAPGWPADIEAPVSQLAESRLAPRRVIVLENLQTLLALPPAPGVVAVFGAGYAVDALTAVPWLARAEITYWGDLDSHGFAILNRLRTRLPSIRSVLMDTATFEDHRDLAVPEPRPASATLPALNPTEQAAYQAVRASGLRLEQERLPWTAALQELGLAGGEANRLVPRRSEEPVRGDQSRESLTSDARP